jgi:tRNA-binding protein
MNENDKSLTWSEFSRVDLRIGTIVTASEFPAARKPALLLEIDFGAEIGILKSSAQITERYQADELAGVQVIAVVNFPDKQIGPVMSQCLVCGFHAEDGSVVLATAKGFVQNGARLC